MKIALNGRPLTEQTRPAIQALLGELARRGAEVQIHEDYRQNIQDAAINHPFTATYQNRQDLFDADFVFSIGGDGTLLETVTHVGERTLPIVGVNTGRLGFLATINPDEITQTLDWLENGKFSIDERVLLHVENDRDVFEGTNFGLNDFVVTKTDRSSMIVVHTWLDGEFLNSYWADGLVISTPTGSTGYCLSVGGPVVLPRTNNFIIAPISPHNLNVRPIVVNDGSRIEVTVESRSKSCLISLDSRSKVVDDSVRYCVRRERFSAHLVKVKGDTFLETLRSKLNWGLDIRN
ncbi:NAD kinase [Siphonobacter sp. BAB-5385]|uniref:NAD kinase n=1 Tax=Siphonobacter curvatus TaxID=2094562 RepID=A0A2S7INC6_9BACT|nr:MULTISPECIES: NAD kinase [Siphonobacter]OZI06741.1 NAD kinase [Siphonobacter sp. BAB-5385]PQA59227.1 NAD kinase [Siphonobacter curvatus]